MCQETPSIVVCFLTARPNNPLNPQRPKNVGRRGTFDNPGHDRTKRNLQTAERGFGGHGDSSFQCKIAKSHSLALDSQGTTAKAAHVCMTTLLRGSPAMPVWPPKALTDRRRPAPDALRAASVLGNQLAEKDGSTSAAHLLQELIKAGLEQPVCVANAATCCRHGHALARTKMREPEVP